MKSGNCFICRSRQIFRPKAEVDLIYDAKGRAKMIPLCYVHSVELFKIGQKSFLAKHSDALSDDQDKLSEFEFRDVIPDKNPHSWF